MMTDDLARLAALLDETAARGESRLPPEPQLSEAIGVSRGRLRTLLRRLEEEGTIWRHVGKGTFIGTRETVEVRALADAPFSVGDVFAARILLEPILAAEAAVHATAENLAAIRQCHDALCKTEGYVQWKRLDDRLHRQIAKATNNPLLLILYDTLNAQIRQALDARLEQVFGHTAAPMSDANAEHGQIVDAICQHNPSEAERAMRDHLGSVRGKLFGIRWTT